MTAGGSVRFPLVREASLRTPRRDPADAIVALAEAQEMRDSNPAMALAEYRRAGTVAQSERVRSLALARTARCLRKLSRPADAAQVWRMLAEEYPDQYDPYGRPYGLLAGLELNLVPAVLYRDLSRGRWEISADQMEYFLGKLGEAAYPGTPFGEHLVAARAFDRLFYRAEPTREGEVYSYAFRAGDHDWQAFYTPLQADGLVVAVVEPAWLQRRLGAFSLVPARQLRGEMTAGFRTVLQSWELSADAALDAARRMAWRWAVTMSLSAVAFLLLFLYGLRAVVLDVRQTTTVNLIRREYLRDVSHALKTPLSIIRLTAESMLSGAPLPEEERCAAYREIVQESEEVEFQITRLLATSYVEDWTDLDLSPGDLAQTLESAVSAYCRYLTARGVQVELDLRGGLPPVRLNAAAVKHAVVNLIDNAVKYSAEPPFVAIRCYALPAHVVCEVEDHGVGIPSGEHTKVFERFFRGGNAPGTSGAGIGLAVVKDIMNAHCGSVELASEPNRGSRFRLKFPVEVSAGKAPVC